jgi:competence protein ComEC
LGIPGEYDQVAREHGRGVYLRGVVKPGLWKTVAPANRFQRGLVAVRSQILGVARAKLTPDSYTVFAGLALGERGMSKELAEAWRDAGVTHLVSISGLHLAMVFLVLKALARALLSIWPPTLLFLNAGWWSGLIAIPGVMLYTLISGSQPPTLRSLAMLVVVFFAQGLGRRVSGLGPLCWGALGLVAVNPSLAKAPGFQLSFAAVAGAIAWSQWVKQDSPAENRRVQMFVYVKGALLSSIVATVWTMPFTTFHFGQVSLIGIVANLPLIPFVSALLTPACFFFACAVALWRDFPLPWVLIEYGCVLANQATLFFASVPGASVHMRIDMVEIGLLLLALAFATVAWTTQKQRWRKRSGVVLALVLAWLGWHEWQRSDAWAGALRVDVLSIGQGDAVLLSSAGKHMLVDTGGGHGVDVYERVLRPYFISQRIGRLEKLVLTHPHEDHVGGAAGILSAMPVGKLIVPSIKHFGATRPEILAAATSKGVPIKEWTAGERFEWFGTSMRVLHPSEAFRRGFSEKANINDLSLVFEARSKDGACLLLTGDAEEEAEHSMAEAMAPCGLLKVGHHGSRTSSSGVLLGRVRPQNALISAGYRNQFRHPHKVTVDRLRHENVRVWTTSEIGTVTALADGKGWKIQGYSGAAGRWTNAEESPSLAVYATRLLGIVGF